MPSTYEVVSEAMSDLFLESIQAEAYKAYQEVPPEGEQRWLGAMLKLLEDHGWTKEQWDQAEDEAMDAYLAELASRPVEPLEPLDIIHMDEFEPEDA